MLTFDERVVVHRVVTLPGTRMSAERVEGAGFTGYRGTSLIKQSLPLGPYSRTMPRALGGPRGGGVFL